LFRKNLRHFFFQAKNGVAETGAQINAACIAVVDAFASNTDDTDDGRFTNDSHHSHHSSYGNDSVPHKPVASQHNTVASHQQVTSQSSNVTQQQQQHSNMTHSMTQGYHLPAKKPRLDQPPVLTLQEANDLKEQISQLHPGVNIIKLFSLSVTPRQNKLMCFSYQVFSA
jgi:hypothetical protein